MTPTPHDLIQRTEALRAIAGWVMVVGISAGALGLLFGGKSEAVECSFAPDPLPHVRAHLGVAESWLRTGDTKR